MPIDEKYAQLWGKWHAADLKQTQAAAAMREARSRDHRAFMQAASESRHWHDEAEVAKILAAQYLCHLGWRITAHKWTQLPSPTMVVARPTTQPSKTNPVAAKPLVPAAVNPNGEARELAAIAERLKGLWPKIEQGTADANEEREGGKSRGIPPTEAGPRPKPCEVKAWMSSRHAIEADPGLKDATFREIHSWLRGNGCPQYDETHPIPDVDTWDHHRRAYERQMGRPSRYARNEGSRPGRRVNRKPKS